MINTTGHNRTPAVRLKFNLFSPKKDKLAGPNPKVSSKENIFTPMNSAMIALAIKNPPSTTNRTVDLSLNIFDKVVFRLSSLRI